MNDRLIILETDGCLCDCYQYRVCQSIFRAEKNLDTDVQPSNLFFIQYTYELYRHYPDYSLLWNQIHPPRFHSTLSPRDISLTSYVSADAKPFRC
jgi:hypothetical protein